ncbi:hypothetical protein EDB85DRAFT_1898928 [Lactarius pseudohatsudake]|nr:hypothetical protein EDB85DRAFT_1898928 [Lactarius pseudohatsudake]
MDVDEIFWTEEPVTNEQKRILSPSTLTPKNSSLGLINTWTCLLDYEGVLATTTCQSCKSAPFEWRLLRLFPCSCPLQGVLPKIPLAASFPQGSEVDWEVLYAIMVAGGWSELASWALWSGVHEIGVSWCRCPEAAEHDIQLMMAGLFPATFRNPKTAFTFRVLEEFHLDNLACKTTPMPDRYRELLRLSRQWRVLTSRKRFGFGYQADEEQKPGSMAIFCALCAQPGINLPEDWKEYENSKSLFMRGFIMDGNFQAEHMKMRNPENDVPLSDGTGFMVSQTAYESHLKSAVQRRQVSSISGVSAGKKLTLKQRSTCHDHRAVNNVNKHSGHLQSTGIGATACVHGNFVPDSVVDFQKGEAQKNMDYSIFKALNFNMEGIEAALISYDVMCQWSVHMMERVNGSNYLKLPDNLELRYSPSFIEGGRQIDGETIETLWAPLNEISRSTRGMSTSHRREVIDDHMNDSNWKKLIDIGKCPSIWYHISAHMSTVVNSLPVRYRRALSGAVLSAAAFESINSSASSESVEAWSTQEVQAQRERAQDVTAMDIYDIKMKRFPSRAEILLELTEKEIDTSGRKGHVAWLASGLRIREMQYDFPCLPLVRFLIGVSQ